jgi:hypothetical protein
MLTLSENSISTDQSVSGLPVVFLIGTENFVHILSPLCQLSSVFTVSDMSEEALQSVVADDISVIASAATVVAIVATEAVVCADVSVFPQPQNVIRDNSDTAKHSLIFIEKYLLAVFILIISLNCIVVKHIFVHFGI